MNNKKQFWTVMFLVTAVALLTANHTGLNAFEFRGFTGIEGAEVKASTQKSRTDIPGGCVEVGSIVPIPRENVMTAMDALAAAWNGTGFSDLLSDEFTSKEQLLQAMTDEVPRDAIFTILSIQSSQTLQQCEITLNTGSKNRLSVVAVIARTQIEFTDPDPDVGFQRIEGTNEYYFRFTQKIIQILVQVPNVKGKPKIVAVKMLTNAGLTGKVDDIATTDPKKDGIVDAQAPIADKKVDPGTEVKLKVWKYSGLGGPVGTAPGSGLVVVRVPDVRGMLIPEAVAKLTNLNLKSKVVDIMTTDPSKDRIVDTQAVKAGLLVARNTEVQLEAWKYTGTLVLVPNVRGKLKREAVAELKGLNLKSKVFDIMTTDPRNHGIVDAQAPIAGKMVAPGTEVNLGLWKHQAPGGGGFGFGIPIVPSVIGFPLSSARTVLGSAGFPAQVTGKIPTLDRYEDDKVSIQTPQPGTKVSRGTLARLILSKFDPQKITRVPDLVNMTGTEAKNELAKVEIKAKIKLVATVDREQDGKVKTQSPAAGKTVFKNSTVTLVISNFDPQQITRVPDLVNMTVTEAENELKKVEIRAESKLVATTDREQDGKVKAHSPVAGKMVLKNSKVTLDVGMWVKNITVTNIIIATLPDVIGMTLAEAKRKLNEEGFHNVVVSSSFVRTDGESLEGRVGSQTISGRFTDKATLVLNKFIPDVIGMTLAEAKRKLNEKDFVNVVVSSSTVRVFTKSSDGRVSILRPNPGATIRPTDNIILFVNKLVSRDSRVVPNVVGMKFDDAIIALSKAELLLNQRESRYVETTDKNNWGKVFFQDPGARQEAPKNSTVTLDTWEEKRPGVITVEVEAAIPDVKGMTVAIAKDRLSDDGGFGNVMVEEKFTTDITKGGGTPPKVTAQDPAAGRMEKKDTEIVLSVWKYVAGGKRFRVPRVTELKLEEAKKILRDAKLNYEISWDTVSDKRRHLLVDSQDPRPGTLMRSTVSPGSVVKLRVFKYIPKVKVPNVVGMSITYALSELKKAGLYGYSLKPGFYGIRPTDVFKQSPAADMSIHPNVSIVLDVQNFYIGPAPPIPVGGISMGKLGKGLREQGWIGNFKIEGYTYTEHRRWVGLVASYLGHWLETPMGGILIDKDVPVKLYKSQSEPFDVLGKTFIEAKKAVESRYYKVKILKTPTTKGHSYNCRVYHVAPGSGALLKPGSTVTLTVYDPGAATQLSDFMGLTNQINLLEKEKKCPGE